MYGRIDLRCHRQTVPLVKRHNRNERRMQRDPNMRNDGMHRYFRFVSSLLFFSPSCFCVDTTLFEVMADSSLFFFSCCPGCSAVTCLFNAHRTALTTATRPSFFFPPCLPGSVTPWQNPIGYFRLVSFAFPSVVLCNDRFPLSVSMVVVGVMVESKCRFLLSVECRLL